MMNRTQIPLPQVFTALAELGCLDNAELQNTPDGFFASTASLSTMLARRGITTVLNSRGESLECGLFFDDWYLYTVPDGAGWVCSLFKMREQESDRKLGRKADGDTPGVTVSFIAMDTAVLLACLQDPTPQNRTQLNTEINRVVAQRGQRHSEALKAYFLCTQSRGAYLIAKLYTDFLASLAKDGCLPVPERYAADRQKRPTGGRIPQFLEANNRAAGRVICDHCNLYISDPRCPTEQERLALLATHTGNISVFSFAAEVQFHARFLTWWARLPIPLIGRSPYDSAIRADMSIGDSEIVGPTPYYRPNSSITKKQYSCHKDTEWIKII